MRLWLDAQLPPALAGWINQQELALEATPVRDLGLRDAMDPEIFQAAREAQALMMTKDRDFIQLLKRSGPPPQVIWLRTGNSSNPALQRTLSTTLGPALELLRAGEPWVEIRPA